MSKIKLDNLNRVEDPTYILTRRNGQRICQLPAKEIKFKDTMHTSETTFSVYKNDCEVYWEQIKDFKLIYCPEYEMFYEIVLNLEESDETVKSISAYSLGVCELSQILLHNIEINTETDIARDDYEITVLYNDQNSNASMLDRILEKAPHYSIEYVSPTIAGIQRTFSFDGKSIYDAFIEIEEEYDCLFDVRCTLDSNNLVKRSIRVYDLKDYCSDCGTRGEFNGTCTNCGGTNIISGYGDDTTIFVSVDNLADNIKYSTDTDSVKNCFKLEAGDDLMTATIRNCNPNGSDYIWYISDDVREDMSTALQSKLETYDTLYESYQKTVTYTPTNSIRTAYNILLNKYIALNAQYSLGMDDLSPIAATLTGYAELMAALYNTIDFNLFLQTSMMPNAELSNTTAAAQVALLTAGNLSPVAVTNLQACSVSTASNAVQGMARVIVDSRYQVKIVDGATLTAYSSSSSTRTWVGAIKVTSYSNEEDTYTTGTITISINSDYATYVSQKIGKMLDNDSDITDIVDMFKPSVSNTTFANFLKQHSLDNLSNLEKCCQGCIDILVEQGIANPSNWASASVNLYNTIYLPYYQKLGLIQAEMVTRENEIATIYGVYNESGQVQTNGMQTILYARIEAIQSALNFEAFIGDTLWKEFAAYRREDTYTNSNYISDGLNTSELFLMAQQFMEVAEKEIKTSATNQHSISATLKNLLAMPEFAPIRDHFEVGNWIRIEVDDEIYKLRLLDYEINYDQLENLSITFSDVMYEDKKLGSDAPSVINSAASMASSYGAVQKQATRGNNSASVVQNWVNKGLALTTSQIVNSADNQNVTWDRYGLLLREYSSIDDNYDDRQLKIINRGLYVTDDNWLTSKAGIGAFTFYNPSTKQTEEGYGVIADKLVGHLILGESLGIYNEGNSVAITNIGITIKNGTNTVFTADTSGNVSIVGSITATSGYIGGVSGWVITSGGIYSGTANTGTSAGDVTLSTSDFTRSINGTSRSNLRFAIGSKFGVKNDGTVYASGGVFSGEITATSLTLGSNVTIPYNKISSTPDLTVYVQQDVTIGSTPSSTTTGFKVSSAGLLTASNAVIYGSIYATSLTLGSGVTVASSSVSGLASVATSGSYSSLSDKPDLTVYIQKDGTIGSTPASDATGFTVSSAGLLQASNAIIYGTVYASAGMISGDLSIGGALKVYQSASSSTIGGYVGFMYGSQGFLDGTTASTNGIVLSNSDGSQYIIVTDTGVRMTSTYNSSERDLYLADGHMRYTGSSIYFGAANTSSNTVLRMYNSSGVIGTRLFTYDVGAELDLYNASGSNRAAMFVNNNSDNDYGVLRLYNAGISYKDITYWSVPTILYTNSSPSSSVSSGTYTTNTAMSNYNMFIVEFCWSTTYTNDRSSCIVYRTSDSSVVAFLNMSWFTGSSGYVSSVHREVSFNFSNNRITFGGATRAYASNSVESSDTYAIPTRIIAFKV